MADYSDYFNTRLAQEVDNVGFDRKPSKYEQLQDASKQKSEELRAFSAQRLQAKEALAKANETSIVTKLGLDEEGTAAQAVNAAASLASGTTRLAGNIVALPSSLAAQAEIASLGQEDFDAYAKYVKGDRSQATMSQLERVAKGGFTLGDVNRAMEGQLGGATALQRIEQSNAQRDAARSINAGFDISNRVNQARRQEFSEELTQNFDTNWGNVTSGFEGRDAKKFASGIAGLLTEAGKAAVNNPGAVSEYVIENIPQLAIGAAGAGGKAAMLAGNVGYAADAFQKGIEKFQTENNGTYPSEKQREEMALWAAGLAAAEQLGDVSILKGAGSAVDAAKATRTGFKDALLGTTKATATEAATEGFQTYGEGQAGLKPATAKEIYEGAVIGGLSGGVMSGGPSLVSAAVNTGGDLVEAAKSVEQKTEASVSSLVTEAIKTGDVSGLVDPTNPNYAPQRAIGALIGNTQAATKPEQKESNLKKADEILATLTTAKEEAATALENTSAEGVQKAINGYQTKLDALDATDPANARQIELLNLGLESLQQELEAINSNPKQAEADARTAKAQLSKAERELKKVADAYGQLKNLVNPAPVQEAAPEQDVTQLIDAADKDSTPDNESASKVITLAMRSPESVSPTQALKLANNASNGLSEDQRSYLRVFSAARIAENEARDMDMVQGEVFFGSPAGMGTNKGIQQYRKEVMEAVQAGNTKRATTSLRGLQRFALDHQDKASVAQDAWEEGKGTQIVRTEAGNWEIAQVRLKPEALKANGGLTINTPKLVEAIQKEAAALDASTKELEQAVAIASKKGNGNVTNQPSKASGTQAQPKADPVQAAAPAGSPAPVQGVAEGVGDGKRSEPVQPASVVEPVASASDTDVNGSPRTQVGPNKDSFTNTNAQSDRDIADAKGLTAKVEAEFAKGKTVGEVRKAMSDDLAFLGKENQSSFLINVRATLGIPSRGDADGMVAFEQWLGDYQKRSAPAATKTDVTATVPTQENWNGLIVYPHIFNGMGKGDVRINEMTHIPGMFELGHVTSKGQRIAGTYQFNDYENWIDDFNITSDSGPSSIDRRVLKSLLLEITKKHPTAEGLSGSRISGARLKNSDTPVELNFKFKNGKLVAYQQVKNEDAGTTVDVVTESTDVQSTAVVAETSTVDKESKDSITAEEQATQPTTENATTESEDRTSVDVFPETISATQAEYDAAVKLNESGTEADYETAPSKVLQVAQALSEDTEVQITEAQPKAGEPVLSAFTEEQAADAPYHLQNLIGKYWNQKAKSSGDAAARPLASVPDFYSALKAGNTKITDFLKEGVLAKGQEDAVKHFFGTAKKWMVALQANMPKKKAAEFRTDAMIQYLLTDGANGVDMDENTKVAIVAAAYSYVLDEAGKSAKMEDKAINSVLARDKDTRVSCRVRDELAMVGTYSHKVYDQVGGRVLDALGLSPKSDASQEQLPKLRSELGIVAVMMMEQLGLVSRTVFSDAEMLSLQLDGLTEEAAGKVIQKRKESNSFAYHTFITLAREADGALPAGAQSIVQANKGTKSIVNKLFKVEGSVRFPSLEPIKAAQKKASGSVMDVPADLRNVIKQNQANPRKINKDMMAVAAVFDGEGEFDVLAGVKVIDEAVTHVVNRGALQAKNEGLQRELRLFMEFVGELQLSEKKLDTDFFLEFDVWKQQRVGIKTNGVNPQASKIVRQMIGSPDWEATIQSTDEEGMTSFYLRVAEGLGEKTEKTTNDKQIKGIKQMLKQPVFADAISALRKIQNGESVSQTDKDAIQAGVSKGGENLHSLASLVAMARQQNAEAQAQGREYEFTTQLMGEVDGVANGTMLNHALLGAGDTEADLIALLNQGGFFEEGRPYTQYNQYRGTMGNLDVYESTARDVFTAVKRLMGASPQMDQKIAAIWGIAGNIFNEETGSVTKEGRNLVKGALNPLAFGSSMNRVVEGMADTFLEAVYSGFEGLAKQGPALTQVQLEAYVDQINDLIPNPKFKVQKGYSLPWHMSRSLHPGAEKAIKEAFSTTVGQATADTVEVKFGAFIAARDRLNYVAQTTYSLHDAVYSGMRAAYVNLLASKGELPTDRKGKVIGDLSADQEAAFAAQLKNVEPVIQTAFSKQSGDTNSGLRAAKRKNKRNPDPVYEARVYFNKKQALGESSVGTSGMSPLSESPGVAMGSATTHSFDSWISHLVQAAMDVLNVHDALGAGVLGLKKAAALLNQKTFEGLVEYSPAEEAYQSLSNVIAGISDLAQSNALPQEALDNLQKVLYKISKDMESTKGNALESLLSYAKRAAYDANTMKLNVLSKIAHVDQYAFEGGNYKVTAEDKDMIAERLAEQSPELSTQDQVSLKALNKLAQTKKVPDSKTLAVPKQAQAEEASFDEGDEFDVVEEATPAKPVSSAFGTLGKPSIEADKDLEAFFKEYPETTAKHVMRMLNNRFWADKATPNQAFMKSLLSALYKVIDHDMPVRYITAKTPADAVLEVPENASRGWYSVNGTAEEINVLSPEFVASGLTPELLIHELVHSALLQVMRSGNPEVQPFIDNLNKLMGKAESYAKTNDLFDKHKAAFENLDEFVTWGMTNPEFQKEVLSQFYMKPADGTKTLVTALQDFIKNITNLLFLQFRKADGKDLRTSVGKNVNGMAILINDVMQVMDKAAKGRQSGVTATVSMAAKIDAMSTMDLFHALDDGKLGKDFQEQVGNLLSSVVQKLHGPFGAFLESFKSGQAVSPLDVWTKALDTGAAPFASKILGSGFSVGVQEAFAIEQVEATVRAALDGNEANTKFAYRELAALYMEARKKLSVEKFHPSDWSTATQTEKDNAQSLHDFVFALEKTNGDKLDHLSRFAALGLAHEGFNSLLKMGTDVEVGRVAKAKGIVKKLEALFQNILEMFSQKITKTYSGQPADAKLKQLVSTLVDIEAKKRHRLAMDAAKAAQGPKSNIVDDATESLRKGVNKVIDSTLIKNSSYRLVRGAGAAARLVANDRVDQFMELVSNLRDKEMAGRPGILAGTFNTVRGPKATMEAMMRVAKGYEGRRKDAITAASKLANQAFGKALSRDQKAGVTRVFLRTGLHTLVDQMSMADIEKLVSDKTALASAITKAEADLSAFPQYQHYFKAQANALAFAKVARNAGTFTMMNAGNIARMFGTAQQDKLSQADIKEATQSIERLVALYALDYSPSVDRQAATEVLRDELSRVDGGNGVEFALKAHKNLEKEAKERLFAGQDALMMHGYTSEIYNPHVEVVVEYVANEKSLLDHGYVKVGPVSHDAADPDTAAQAIYLLKDGGLSPYQSGALSITNKKAKGSEKHSGYTNPNTFEGAWNASLQADIMNAKKAEIAAMFKPAPRKDLSKERGDKLAPVLNAQGEIVNWRYLMSEKNKDALLDRDNGFDKVLGAIAGSIYGKSTTQEQNSTVLETLKEVYDAEVATNPDSFIEISAKSDDPEMKEIWNMLPAETKRTAMRIFGPGGIRVRKDSLDLVFGYRKLSLATMFNKADRNKLEDIFVSLVEGTLVLYAYGKGMRGQKARDYAKRAAVVVTKSERMWQSLVQETKDIIVVKTGTVLAGNVWSNLSLLWLKGVSLKDMAHHHAVALAGATSYMADSNELDRLRLLQQSGYVGTEEGGMKGIEDKIALLEDALSRNPVKELIDAGLMPSIVEDVAAEEDPYSYKSLLVRKMESATEGVPKPLITAAKAVYMSKDGALYKGLYRATQLSDFVARYTLYQHLISREKNPLSKEAALFEASETFVNYDLPMHRALQYTDDMGLTPFMKYFLNIQRVLQKTMRDNPARVLGMAVLGNVMDLGPIVLSSAAITRVGNNPLQSGAFKFFGTVDDLATINASMALIK